MDKYIFIVSECVPEEPSSSILFIGSLEEVCKFTGRDLSTHSFGEDAHTIIDAVPKPGYSGYWSSGDIIVYRWMLNTPSKYGAHLKLMGIFK